MAISAFGHYPAPDPAGQATEPVVLDAAAAEVRAAYQFVRAFEAAHPEVTVRRPWSRGNHRPRWHLVGPAGTRELRTVLDVHAAIESDYPAPPAEGSTP